MFLFLIFSVLGAGGNSRAYIRGCANCNQLVNIDARGILSENEYREFYISFKGKHGEELLA